MQLRNGLYMALNLVCQVVISYTYSLSNYVYGAVFTSLALSSAILAVCLGTRKKELPAYMAWTGAIECCALESK